MRIWTVPNPKFPLIVSLIVSVSLIGWKIKGTCQTWHVGLHVSKSTPNCYYCSVSINRLTSTLASLLQVFFPIRANLFHPMKWVCKMTPFRSVVYEKQWKFLVKYEPHSYVLCIIMAYSLEGFFFVSFRRTHSNRRQIACFKATVGRHSLPVLPHSSKPQVEHR